MDRMLIDQPAGVPRPDGQRTVAPIERWSGPWASDDPNANFKADVALYALVDPMTTMRGLAEAVDLPVGAIVHYVLARYAAGGSAGLLELGPTMVERLWSPVESAERSGDDKARLAAYHELRQVLSWLRAATAQARAACGGAREGTFNATTGGNAAPVGDAARVSDIATGAGA